MAKQITEWTTCEAAGADIDACLGGLTQIFRLVLSKSPEIMKDLHNPEALVKVLLDGLFCMDRTSPKCKSEKTRTKTLQLLSLMIRNFSGPSVSSALRYLNGLHIAGSWRTNNDSDWSLHPGLDEKTAPHVGLCNLGSTCYMNSSLQQFFMIPGFRNRLLAAEYPRLGDENSMLYQLQLLFASLDRSQRAALKPKAFAETVKMDGKVISVGEQKDVDEFITTLLDQTEQALRGSAQSRLIKDMFKLTLANEIISKECPHRSETTEEAISLILSVKNKKSLHESLSAYVQSDTLEGENAYQCERCAKRVAAYKRQNIKTLPNVLVVVMKRFEFNVETLARMKVNDYCEFPHDLDMEEFTQERQTFKDLGKDIESGKLSEEDLTEEQRRLLHRKMPKEYYRYRLKGIIVHSGGADSGHYYSYIMDRERQDQPEERRWLEFNDRLVREFNPQRIPDETFGGEEPVLYEEEARKRGDPTTKEKTNNAYVLFYERTVQLDMCLLEQFREEEAEFASEEVLRRFKTMIVTPLVGADAAKLPPKLDVTIHKDNKRFWLSEYMFQPNYLSFMASIVSTLPISEDSDYISARKLLAADMDPSIEPAQFATVYLLTVQLRAKSIDHVPTLLAYIKQSCRRSVRFCVWLAGLFSHPEIVHEFITDCPSDHARHWVAGILRVAMGRLYEFEAGAIGKLCENKETLYSRDLFMKAAGEDPSSFSLAKEENVIQIVGTARTIPCLVMLINTLVQQVPELKLWNCGQYFQTLCNFARLGAECRRYLNACSMLGVTLELLYFTASKCVQTVAKQLVHLVPTGNANIGTMVHEPVYVGKKVMLQKQQHQYVFMLELMNRLVHSVAIPKLGRKSEDTPQLQITATEENYLDSLKQPKVLEALVDCCTESKAGLTYLSKTLAYLAFGNSEFIDGVLKLIINKTAVAECNRLRLYFRIAYFLLANKDKYINKLDIFLRYLHHNFQRVSNCYRVSEEYIDFLIKMCRNNEIFLCMTRKEDPAYYSKMLEAMETWTRENPFPSSAFKVRFSSRSIGFDIQDQA